MIKYIKKLWCFFVGHDGIETFRETKGKYQYVGFVCFRCGFEFSNKAEIDKRIKNELKTE